MVAWSGFFATLKLSCIQKTTNKTCSPRVIQLLTLQYYQEKNVHTHTVPCNVYVLNIAKFEALSVLVTIGSVKTSFFVVFGLEYAASFWHAKS